MTQTRYDSDDGQVRQSDTTTEAVAARSCPECDGRVVEHEDRGEATCAECGLVLDEDAIDRGPEWRSFEDGDRDGKSRVGAPTTELMHDRGLSTNIGWRDADAYGETLSARKRARMQRLRTWDERFRAKDAQERNLKQAFGEIDRMASALDLSEPVRETAGALYRRAVEAELLPGRSIEGMATASLYAATRQHGAPRRVTEFADVSRVRKKRVQRAYRYLKQELGLAIEPEDPTRYVPQFASSLDVSDEAERLARELLDVAKREGAHSGKSPAGLAAAAIYAAANLTNEKLTQAAVSSVADVSRVTIRDRYQELLDVYAAREE
ncbi:transcription initiation factor IIB [Halosimplex pelagicum]|uniref:Transcription initiation factor IIB n=1 Tax=Halosimplex pelagicum TaxID=869886 RepID=A0A7D5P5P2_9EURY|nr:TFIIB-type zinc ribbon-containing protein [Halosimplex pelagicum]QLH81406.1 transcription initiation factor IIB 2 [Halosimplex pelagicum]